MKKFLKENWFKIILLILVAIGVLGYGLSKYTDWQKQKAQILSEQQSRESEEELRKEELKLEKERLRLQEEEEKKAEEDKMWNKMWNMRLLDACLDDAYANYESNWNGDCAKLGWGNKCSLPSGKADRWDEIHKQAKDECYKKYPQ